MMEIKNTTGVTLLIDTFCATGCDYCELSTHKKNQFQMPYESLDDYMNVVQPANVIIFGGDTFYDHENIIKAYTYVAGLHHVKSIASVSEIQKIDRDFDIRAKVAKICKDNNKYCGISFSLDIGGKKTGDYVDTINRLVEVTGSYPSFDSVITVNDINTDGIDRLKSLVETYQRLTFKTTLNIILDYRAVITTNIDKSKLVKFIDELNVMVNDTSKQLMVRYRTNQCSVRGGQGDLINQEGRMSTCGKVRPEYDMEYINVKDVRTEQDYLRLKEMKYKFRIKTYNDICAMCPANKICCRCPKFVNLIDGKVGQQDTCLFYKEIYSRQPAPME